MTSIHDPVSFYHLAQTDLDERRVAAAIRPATPRARIDWTPPLFAWIATVGVIGGALTAALAGIAL